MWKIPTQKKPEKEKLKESAELSLMCFYFKSHEPGEVLISPLLARLQPHCIQHNICFFLSTVLMGCFVCISSSISCVWCWLRALSAEDRSHLL